MQAAHNNQDGRGEEPRANVPKQTPEQKEFAEMAKSFEMEVFGHLLCRTKNPSDAWDLTQETFLKAWRAWPSVTKSGKIRAWLFTISERIWIDDHRTAAAEKRGKPASLDAMTCRGSHDGEAGSNFDPEDCRSERTVHEELEFEEDREALAAAIPLLSSDDQELIHLYLAGKSYAEIANETRRSAAAIGPALTRIRAHLREIVNRDNQSQ